MLISGFLRQTVHRWHKPSSRQPLLYTRPAVTFPASERHCHWSVPSYTAWWTEASVLCELNLQALEFFIIYWYWAPSVVCILLSPFLQTLQDFLCDMFSGNSNHYSFSQFSPADLQLRHILPSSQPCSCPTCYNSPPTFLQFITTTEFPIPSRFWSVSVQVWCVQVGLSTVLWTVSSPLIFIIHFWGWWCRIFCSCTSYVMSWKIWLPVFVSM